MRRRASAEVCAQCARLIKTAPHRTIPELQGLMATNYDVVERQVSALIGEGLVVMTERSRGPHAAQYAWAP